MSFAGDLDRDHLRPEDFLLIDDVLCVECFRHTAKKLLAGRYRLRQIHVRFYIDDPTTDRHPTIGQLHPQSHSRSHLAAWLSSSSRRGDDSSRPYQPVCLERSATPSRFWLRSVQVLWPPWQNAPVTIYPAFARPTLAPNTKPDRNGFRDCQFRPP